MGLINNTGINLVQKSLDAVWLRQNVIANNIANKDTPGFQSSKVEFEEAMKEAILKNTSNENKLKTKIKELEASVTQTDNVSTREDGNNVNTEDENIELARAQMQYDTLIYILNSQLSTIRNALSGG